MRIYCLGLGDDRTPEELVACRQFDFAWFSAIGTWSDGKFCKVCTGSGEDLIEPLLVQWEPSSDIIGDFSWDGPEGYTCLIQESVANYFRKTDFECDFLCVEYVSPERKKPRRKQVPFPYNGPKQYWLSCNAVVDADHHASEIKLEKECHECGRKYYTFKRDGIVIRPNEWNGSKLFELKSNEGAGVMFVTEEGKSLIESQGFTNFQAKLAGEIVGR